MNRSIVAASLATGWRPIDLVASLVRYELPDLGSTEGVADSVSLGIVYRF